MKISRYVHIAVVLGGCLSAFLALALVLAPHPAPGRTAAGAHHVHQEHFSFTSIAMAAELPPRPKPPKPPDPPPDPDPPPNPDPVPDPVARTPTGNHSPNVAVSLHIEPNIWVARGTTLVCTVRTHNLGNATASHVYTYLPYNQSKVMITKIVTATTGDYVVQHDHNNLTLLQQYVQPNEVRLMRVEMQVNGGLPEQTLIRLQGFYNDDPVPPPFDDNGTELLAPGSEGQLGKRTNIAPVLVGTVSETSPLVWMTAIPIPAPTLLLFFSDRFLPGEPVDVWLNTSTSAFASTTIPLEMEIVADSEGHIRLSLPCDTFPPGNYQLVVRGRRSDLQAAIPFTL